MSTRLSILAAAITVGMSSLGAADWPTYRHDNQRSGTTTEELDLSRLALAWTHRSAQPPQPAWAGPAKWDAYAGIRGLRSMRNYDPVFHVTAAAGLVFFGSSADDSVYALDAASGEVRWTVTTDGPVRIAPTYSRGHLYFGSDDGRAYCVRASDGTQRWVHSPETATAPLILHNGRMISRAPCRTGVLVRDGIAYFAGSLLPWEPSYLAAVDAETGVATGEGRYIAPQAGLTLEGALLASSTLLVAPQGRIEPLLMRRSDGARLGGLKGGGGCFVLLTSDSHILYGPGNKTGWITDSSTETREKIASYSGGNSVVVAGDIAYLLTDDAISALDRSTRKPIWTTPTRHPYDLIFAGGTLFAGGQDSVVAIDALTGEIHWRAAVPGRAYGLAVADGRLFVSTDSGAICCFEASANPDAASPQAVAARADGESPRSEARIAPIAAAGLLGRWVFSSAGVRGRVVTDQAGSSNATISASPRLGVANGIEALLLDGSTSIVVRTSFRDAAQPVRAMTASAWVRIDQPLSWGGILGAVQDNGEEEQGWILGYVESRFSFALRGKGGTGRLTYLTDTRDFVPGRWYHVAGVYDGREMRLYVDGQHRAASTEQSGEIVYPPSAPYEIAAYHDDDENFRATGAIAEARLYRRALSLDEIAGAARDREPVYEEIVTLARGPALEFTARGTARVTWESAAATPSVVEVASDDGSVRRFEDRVEKTRHTLTIDGLEHRRVYECRIKILDEGVERSTAPFECDTFFDFSVPPVRLASHQAEAKDEAVDWDELAKQFLDRSGVDRGVALVLGVDGGRLAHALARRSRLRVIGVDTDRAEIASARAWLRSEGAYGARVTLLRVESLEELPFAGQFANLVVMADLFADGRPAGRAAELYRQLRPAGGTAILAVRANGDAIESRRASLELARWLDRDEIGHHLRVDSTGAWVSIVRGEIPGAGEWSHQYGRADNSAYGGEALGGAKSSGELLAQWIGRPGPRAQPDRNGRKPAPLAVNGRLFVQGLRRLVALDAYNGSVLWALEIPEIERFNLPRDCSNWCADDRSVYAAIRGRCWKIAAATGSIDATFAPVVERETNEMYDWGYVARVGDRLLGSAVRRGSAYTNFWGNANAGWYDATHGPATYKVCSESLFALSAADGSERWTYAGGLVINSTITATDDRVFFIESRNDEVRRSEARRVGSSALWKDQFLVALDGGSGERIWSRPIDTADGIVVFYLAASEEQLVLVSSGAKTYHVYAFAQSDGEPLWEVSYPWEKGDHGAHMSRPAIVGGSVYVRPRAYDLATGRRLEHDVPGGGCGTYAATDGALIFRAGNVTLWSREDGETTSWTRLRPDCWLSTIPSGGMLLSPEGGGGCSCGSWLETSVGFLPRAVASR